MTTTILVHNAHRAVNVVSEDRVWNPQTQALTDDWHEVYKHSVEPGQLYQTFCTDTRRVTIIERPIERMVAT